MNKREKSLITSLIAEWEFATGSAAEAAACAGCALDLRTTLGIAEDDEDLIFSRQYHVLTEVLAGKIPDSGTEAFSYYLDALTDLTDEIGWDAVCDMLEEEGALAGRLRRDVTALLAAEEEA